MRNTPNDYHLSAQYFMRINQLQTVSCGRFYARSHRNSSLLSASKSDKKVMKCSQKDS